MTSLLLSLCLLLMRLATSTEAFVGNLGLMTTTSALKSHSMVGHVHVFMPHRTCEPPHRLCMNLESVAASSEDGDDAHALQSSPRRDLSRNLPLQRFHERFLFLFYTCAGTASYYFTATSSTAIQAAICLVWTSFILAISFMEAWVKFRAPFLRKHVAVDVGRHVFAALNAVELGLAASVWLGRSPIISAEPVAPKISITYPNVATALLLLQAFYISPKLFVRAKDRILKCISTADQLTAEEEDAFQEIQNK